MPCPRPADDDCTDQTTCVLCPHQPPSWGWITRAVLVCLGVGLIAAGLALTPLLLWRLA